VENDDDDDDGDGGESTPGAKQSVTVTVESRPSKQKAGAKRPVSAKPAAAKRAPAADDTPTYAIGDDSDNSI
jgi:hypothetical protein